MEQCRLTFNLIFSDNWLINNLASAFQVELSNLETDVNNSLIEIPNTA